MFLFMGEYYIPFHICTTASSIHSSADGHLGCFHVLAIVNTAAMKNVIHVSFSIFFPQGICLGVGLLGHRVVLCLLFKGIFIHSSTVAVSIYISTSNARRFPFSTPSPAFIACRLFDDGHSNWYEVVSHCSFDLHFSNNEWCWASFYVLVSHLYVWFGEMSL